MSAEPEVIKPTPAHNDAHWMVNIMSISEMPAMLSGVYFLLQGNKVVYVGQSVCVMRRIADHLNSAGMEFDRFSWINVDPGLLNVVEEFYISKLVPEYNSCSVVRSARRARQVQPLPHEEQPRPPLAHIPPMAPKEVMNTADAATYTGVGKATLENWRCNRKGPPFMKLGGAVRYRRTDLDQWIEKCSPRQ